MLKKIIANIIIISMILCIALPALAKMRSDNKMRAGTPPYEVIKKITSANNRAITQKTPPKTSGFAPYMTWITDPDPRITRNLIMPASGEVYTIRNMGSQLETNAAAVDYGVRQLLTPLLLITVNSDNQAVKYFIDGHADQSPALRRELDHLHLALKNIKQGKKPAEVLRHSIEANVDFQVMLAVKRYKDRVQAGRLVVVGSVIDLTNTYKRGKGRLIIININNEKESKNLRSLPMLKSINPKFAKLSIGRDIAKKK